MNFWYLPKGAEDEKFEENTKTTKELNTKDKQINDKGESNNKQRDEIKEHESSVNPEKNMTTLNKTTPEPYSAGELIGLSRDIEAMVEEALGDATKVNSYLLSSSECNMRNHARVHCISTKMSLHVGQV